MPKVKCEICGITTTRTDNKKRLFMAQFPLDEDRCREWVRVTGKEDLAHVPIEKLHQLKHICGNHFRTKDFKKKKTQLRKAAIPCIGITAEPLSESILKDFPLHVAKTAEKEQYALRSVHIDVHSQISKEHSYCKSGFGTSDQKPITPTLCTTPHQLDRRRSSINQEITHVQLKRKISSSSVAEETLSVTLRKKSSSPQSSMFIQENLVDSPKQKQNLDESTKKMTIKILKNNVHHTDKINSPVVKNLNSAPIVSQREPLGKEESQVIEIRPLANYKQSPKTNEYHNQSLQMPSLGTLQAVLENIKMDTGLYPHVMYMSFKNTGTKNVCKDDV